MSPRKISFPLWALEYKVPIELAHVVSWLDQNLRSADLVRIGRGVRLRMGGSAIDVIGVAVAKEHVAFAVGVGHTGGVGGIGELAVALVVTDGQQVGAAPVGGPHLTVAVVDGVLVLLV